MLHQRRRIRLSSPSRSSRRTQRSGPPPPTGRRRLTRQPRIDRCFGTRDRHFRQTFGRAMRRAREWSCHMAVPPPSVPVMQNNSFAAADPTGWHGTTILCVRRDGHVTMAGDGQVSMGQTIVKGNARKVRRIGNGGAVVAGFAGATADAFTLLERLESKLERYPNQLERACVELAKDWRTDRYLRRLEALMAVADKERSFTLTGNGDVLEPEAGIIAIGSGGNYALAAARALAEVEGLSSEEMARRAMKIAGDICVYTNYNLTVETL